MSGSVQAPLSPILQERRDSTANSVNKKRPFGQYHPHHSKSQWKQKNQQLVAEAEKNAKKRLKTVPKVQLPNKFLLGGNITDPLNLNGLLNENMEETADTSPLPPVPPHRNEIVNLILRPNIKDPLNLEGTYDTNRANLLVNKRHRKHRRSLCKPDDANDQIDASCSIICKASHTDPSLITSSKSMTAMCDQTKRKRASSLSVNITTPTNYCLNRNKTKISQSDNDDQLHQQQDSTSFKAKRMLSDSFLNTRATNDMSFEVDEDDDLDKEDNDNDGDTDLDHAPNTSMSIETPVKSHQTGSAIQNNSKTKKIFDNKNDFKFRYGNYNRYYGYRNLNDELDHRLDHMKAEWFRGKQVLDIGCNVGHVTLHIASKFEPKSIVGVDIDTQLIFAARKNIRSYVDKIETEKNKYPASFKINYGPLMSESNVIFPKNVFFTQCNYVPESDDRLAYIQSEYDFILALSITKWIHLNWGDDGIKRFFKKIYLHLHQGGHLLLEPQSWASYKKKAKLTKDTYENFQNIQMRPNEFTKYLLSKEVGFTSCKSVATPFNKSKGFRRSILLFTKL